MYVYVWKRIKGFSIVATNVRAHTHTHTQSEMIQFHNVRVDDPSQLLINGQKLPQDKLAQSTVAITAFS